MNTDDHHSAPFPSRGKGRGWGGGTLRQDVAREASSSDGRSHCAPSHNHPASTPPNPPPRGEGFDRFAGADRIKPGGVQRGRRLRATPTFTEEKLWKRLRALPVRFRRQAPIGPYVVDFACHRARLVIEVDGGVHNLPEVAVRDLQRDEWLSTQGYRVIRFTTKQVEDDIEGVLAAIRNTSPFPLDGEGVGGWGGGSPCPNVVREASSNGDRSPSARSDNQPASTPSQPSPLEGEGSDNHLSADVNHQGGRALWRARDQWVRDDEI